VRSHWEALPGERQAAFRFHHISTDEVFGSLGPTGRFSETTPYDPRSPYSASKAASDQLVNAWHHTYGLPVVLTNCSNNYGPWQFPEKLIPVVILKAAAGEPIQLYGDGQNVRDWLYVDDHVDALLLAACRGELGRSYCVGGHGERTNKQVVEAICTDLDELLTAGAPHSRLITPVTDRPATTGAMRSIPPGSARSWAGSRATALRRAWRPRCAGICSSRAGASGCGSRAATPGAGLGCWREPGRTDPGRCPYC